MTKDNALNILNIIKNECNEHHSIGGDYSCEKCAFHKIINDGSDNKHLYKCPFFGYPRYWHLEGEDDESGS